MEPIIIIGTGLAGYGVARELRRHDQQAPLILISRDDGASYYKPGLSEALAKGQAPIDLVQQTAGQMAALLDAKVHTQQRVESIEPRAHQIHLAGAALCYSKLVLAWGAEPITLELCGDAAGEVHKINSLADYRRLRQQLSAGAEVAIIGAGLIGCEFANDLCAAGHPVQVADPAATALAQLVPARLGVALERALAGKGVTWHLGQAAIGVHRASGGRLRVQLDRGAGLEADLVISAVGLRPRIGLAREAGLAVSRGIVVDRTLRTSEADIYALGDCAEVDGHWRPYVAPLLQCARALGKTLAGGGQTPGRVCYPALPIMIKTPVCPVIVHPPLDPCGEWRITGDGDALEAGFFAKDGKLSGFALTGEATAKRKEYLKAMPALMD